MEARKPVIDLMVVTTGQAPHTGATRAYRCAQMLEEMRMGFGDAAAEGLNGAWLGLGLGQALAGTASEPFVQLAVCGLSTIFVCVRAIPR